MRELEYKKLLINSKTKEHEEIGFNKESSWKIKARRGYEDGLEKTRQRYNAESSKEKENEKTMKQLVCK